MINRVVATLGLTLALTLALSATVFAGDVSAPGPTRVPEPATSLLLLGGLGVAWWGARRRSK